MSPAFGACDHTTQFLSDRRQKLRLVAGSHDHCSRKPFAFAHQILSQQKRPHAVSKHIVWNVRIFLLCNFSQAVNIRLNIAIAMLLREMSKIFFIMRGFPVT